MRVISEARLVGFWRSRKADAGAAERDLVTWYKLARNAKWPNFAALKPTFGSANQVGDCVVFDVGNNRSRLIGRMNYRRGVIYVLKVMDHTEYDKTPWGDACGCHEPPPKVALRKGKPTSGGPKGGQ